MGMYIYIVVYMCECVYTGIDVHVMCVGVCVCVFRVCVVFEAMNTTGASTM